jgi:YfiH family protein
MGCEMREVLLADNLQNLSGARHGFFTRAWGNCGLSEKFDMNKLAANRRLVAERLGVAPDHLLSCYQMHSPDVVTVTEAWEPRQRPRADAMVTKTKGIALGILTADCAPLLFADPAAGVIGAAHAGWRGALTGVIENTLAAMEALGARISSIQAALGPCIGWNSYEVGPEFPAPFLAENPAFEKFFRPAGACPREGGGGDHYMFNLSGYVEAKLRAAGVASIEPPPADTCADEARFFSYRRDTLRKISPTESLISAIALVD